MPNKQPRKEDVLNILNEYGIPLNKLIGWRPNYEKQKEHMNRLRLITMMGSKGTDNDYRPNLGLHQKLWKPKGLTTNIYRN